MIAKGQAVASVVRLRTTRVLSLGAGWLVLLCVGCHDSNDVTGQGTGRWASVEGTYQADFNVPCGAAGPVNVSVVQTGSEVSAVIPGFGSVEGTAAPAGSFPRITSATLTVLNVCGHITETFSGAPTDDGRVLTWSFIDGRGEACGCGIGTLAIDLKLRPK
jgi:hypothetical protein